MAVAVASLLDGLVVSIGQRAMDCEKHGPYVSVGRRLMTAEMRETWTGCPRCQAESLDAERRAADEARAAARTEAVEAAIGRAAVPSRFRGRSFADFVCDTQEQKHARDVVQAYARDFDQRLADGSMLILSGGVGTGKTHLACAALQAVMPARSGLYITTMGLMRMVRDTWSKASSKSESDVLNDLAAIDLLVIDEVGVQYGTDAEKVLLFEILDRRYLDRRPTIMLTNLGLKAFGEYVGQRIVDRMKEVGRWVPFDWASHRPAARREWGGS